MSLSFGELKVFDIQLIKSQAIYILSTTGELDRYKAMLKSITTYVAAKGYQIEFDQKDLLEKIKPSMRNQLRDQSADQIIEAIFKYFETNKIEYVKDLTREDTWSSLTPSLYAVGMNINKKSWVY